MLSKQLFKPNNLFSEITEIPDIFKQSHIFSLDGFRAISILYVLVAHFNAKYQNPVLLYIFGGGELGVIVFFVISGFLITTLLIKEKVQTNNINLRKFYIRRFLRILPVAYLFLFVLICLKYLVGLDIPFTALIGAFLFLGNFSFFQTNWFTAHYWSLSVEEQFYLLFPIILKKGIKLYVIFIIILVTIIYLEKFLLLNFLTNLIPYNYIREFFNHFDAIAIGSIVSIMIFKNILPISYFVKHKIKLFLITIPILVLVNNNHLPDLYKHFFAPLNNLICALIVAILIISNIPKNEDWVFKLLNNRYITKLGILSYSIYIWQQLFTSNKVWFPETSDFFLSRLPLIVTIPLLFITGYISYHFYEKKFLKYKARFK